MSKRKRSVHDETQGQRAVKRERSDEDDMQQEEDEDAVDLSQNPDFHDPVRMNVSTMTARLVISEQMYNFEGMERP